MSETKRIGDVWDANAPADTKDATTLMKDSREDDNAFPSARCVKFVLASYRTCFCGVEWQSEYHGATTRGKRLAPSLQ